MTEEPFSLEQAEHRIRALETLVLILLRKVPAEERKGILEDALPTTQMQHPGRAWMRYFEDHLLAVRSVDKPAD